MAKLRQRVTSPVSGRYSALRRSTQEALQLSLPNFEDSVTAAAAQQTGCDFIITRDLKGFRGSPIRSLTPEAALPLLGNS
uniref:PilT domain-containing protein n=1 Tax=uncultured Acidobacteriota bacterium TaxID=171953 RepID=G9C5G7_9BACT|nr:PilT domain-containing protein [uncultured Acidobacteriota bacterium]